MTRSYDTPEFLRWSLDRSCVMRPVDRNDDPEWVDRYVRGIRVASEAIACGRVIDGVALEPSACDPRTVRDEPAGFVLDEVLSLQGGAEAIGALCDNCPANVDRGFDAAERRAAGRSVDPMEEGPDNRPAWGGCFGMIEWSTLGADFLDRVEQLPGLSRPELFLPTRPRWHGVWTTTDWTAERLESATSWLDVIIAEVPGALPLFGGLRAALRAARAAGRTTDPTDGTDSTVERLTLRTRLYPGGRVEGTVWTVAAHCRRCAATRDGKSVTCDVCGLRGGVTAARQRGVRGTRPYGPLERFLGAAAARTLLARYWSRALPAGDGRVS